MHEMRMNSTFIFAVVFFVATFTSCQDVVRRLDDKYRPVVPEPVRSVTIVTDGIDSTGVPLRLANLEIGDLKLKTSGAGGDAVPFTPKLEADTQHEGLAYIRTPSNGKVTTDFSITVEVCSKADDTVYASHTFTADNYPLRIFQVDGETYKFELKRMYHCDGGSGNPENNSPTYEPKEMSFADSIMTLQDGSSDGKTTGGNRDGTTVICKHTGDFSQNNYDYFEIKFRSDENVASVIKLTGANGFTFTYDSGVCTATDCGEPYSTTYSDSNGGWVTLGFWNADDSLECLFVEDWQGKKSTAKAASLSGNSNYAYFNVDTDDDSPTEIDYVAFFKRVQE